MDILIIDDDCVDRKIIKKSLCASTSNDHHIVEASSVLQGIKAIKNRSFDVIILDYRMPDVNGLELLIDLRSKPDLGDTAIIMASGSEESHLSLACIEAGAQDFISKQDINRERLDKALQQAKTRFQMEQKKHASYLQVKEMAEKDALTGLSNRYHFDEMISVLIANSKRNKQSIALLSLDLDSFKIINDTLGHSAGDAILKEVVNRISSCLRSNEGFARVGGDEFAIVIGGIQAISIISVITNRICDVFKSPFKVENHEVYCGVSIGVALFPTDACNAQELMKCADIAMYRAKQSEDNNICYFKSEYQQTFHRRFSIQNSMSTLLDSSSFTLVYQPVFSTITSELTSIEALIRWPKSETIYTPDEFIPIAEESGIMVELGQWIIKTAIAQLSVWHHKFSQKLALSINISPLQLRDAGFTEFLVNTCQKSSIHNQYVTLEITEPTLFKKNEVITHTLKHLCELGFNLALDGFGLGLTSINLLTTSPISIVKLDKSMLTLNPCTHFSMLKALSLMLNTLEYSIVAKGVETQQQLDQCAELSLAGVQGFLLAKPMSTEHLEKRLEYLLDTV
ncbi:EAL domain-containing protein [Pseudoalteromonas sp. MMG013]|uniref:two-component system response regulator n=1 Tax=Pseudoalteromonas sp. MMG013 TaxID=2822687 RepID=UPI001B379908|nr:GGDEF domain-containing response regulator [Pseudoalteromonas sp. MMG013]MBQ4864674.1 EAL domain-containing protein [Pseudoalteromonas sp. MMG013]